MERHGFIHEKLDIKILILYILRRLPGEVDPHTLAELCQCDEGIGYFDYSDCLAELVESAHITESPTGYTITEKGIRNADTVESSLPYSVRRKAEKLIALKDIAPATTILKNFFMFIIFIPSFSFLKTLFINFFCLRKIIFTYHSPLFLDLA